MRKTIILCSLFTFLLISGNIRGQDAGPNVKGIPELNSANGLGDIFYTVQVGYFSHSKTKKELFDIEDLYYYKTGNGKIVYVSGVYKTKGEAVRAVKKVMEKGVPDAFVSVIDHKNRGSSPNGTLANSIISYKLDSLAKIVNNTKADYQKLADSLNLTLNIINSIKNDGQKTDKSSNIGVIYWVIIIVALLVALFAVFLIFYYQKKNKSNSEMLESKIIRERQIFQGEIGNAKHEMILENNHTRKLVMLDRLLGTIPLKQHSAGRDDDIHKLIGPDNNNGFNHSYSLKMANEITNMRNQLHNLAENTPGKNKLEEILHRVEEQFDDSSYKIVNLENKDFKKGMDVITNSSIPKTKTGEKLVIAKVIKPQVDFRGETIQKAVVELGLEKVKTTIK